jgi:aldose 1-epimerase
MLTLAVGDATVLIDPDDGGRIESLAIGGRELLVPRNDDPTGHGLFVMAPWAGRIRHGRLAWEGEVHQLPVNMAPHAIHGTTFDRPWTVDSSSPSDASLSCALGDRWPWPGRARHEIALAADQLALRLEVATDGPAFPAWCGWHPWFRRDIGAGGPAELRFDAGSMFERDAEGMPTGRRVPPPPGPWDDCFTDLAGSPELCWPDALRLTIESPAPDLVVYDEPAQAICVEPQSAPPDAVALGLAATVTVDAPLVLTAVLRWAPVRAGEGTA